MSQILDVFDGRVTQVETLSQFIDDGFGRMDDVQKESEFASVSNAILMTAMQMSLAALTTQCWTKPKLGH